MVKNIRKGDVIVIFYKLNQGKVTKTPDRFRQMEQKGIGLKH